MKFFLAWLVYGAAAVRMELTVDQPEQPNSQERPQDNDVLSLDAPVEGEASGNHLLRTPSEGSAVWR